jgi:hypothetical protein
MPWVAQRGEEIPYVQVVADRTGADLTGVAVGGAPRRREVQGHESFPLRRVQAGGWSHRRYQQAAEESWKRNAGDVVAAAVELAEAVGAEVLVVGGDVRAVQFFTDQLPARWKDRVVATDAGSRHAGSDDAPLDDVTIQAVADIAGRHVRAVLDRYEAQRADRTAATGLTDVVTRLQRGQVETVLLVNDASSTDTVWIDPAQPTVVATDEQLLRQSGVSEPQRVRADAALLRAAAATSAGIVLVAPDEVALEHGIGAVLRYPDGATAAD